MPSIKVPASLHPVVVGNTAPSAFASWQMRLKQFPSMIVNVVAAVRRRLGLADGGQFHAQSIEWIA
jgi:hypothetical protein